MGVSNAFFRKLRRDERLCDAQSLFNRDFCHRQFDWSTFELGEIENHVHQCQQMLLRLVDAIHVLSLFFI